MMEAVLQSAAYELLKREEYALSAPIHTNRLINETSPYLLQHAHNPVDWYPWGEEALTKARTEDKPILISVGYSACHWCHVMEDESFADPDTAALMNELFVNIKVDREERPDLDSIYMTAVQAMTGQGGWPLNVFLLPDGTPFYGGTYFPPDEKAARYRMPSFKQLLLSIAEAYRTRRDELVQAGQELIGHIQQLNEASNIGEFRFPPRAEVLDNAFQGLARNFDQRNGGFGGAPKFPQPMTLEFLLRYHVRTGNAEALHMLEHTLRKMALGGIYDQIGGGFHRYSVDDHWLVPHFEKMLYDNALLARMYVEIYQVTGDSFYARIADETLVYLAREMLHPAGGFYSTQDADSEPRPGARKEEGAFFVWTTDEVREALGENAALFCTAFDVSRQGNFEGRTILHMPRPLAEIARVTGAPPDRLEEAINRGRATLFAAREHRPNPHRDEKVLTVWNGMALRALAAAAMAFGEDKYLALAQRNADFLLNNLRRSDGRLLRSWKDGKAALLGYLEDYALLADGLLALYSADGNPRWLRETIALADAMLTLFWDDNLGGFYDTASDHETLVTRPRDVGDNATPAGNSVAVEVFLRLAALTGDETYRTRAEQVLNSLTAMMVRMPAGFGRLLCAADFAEARVKEAALVGDPAAADMRTLLDVVQRPYRPYVVLAQLQPGDTLAPSLTPLLQERTMIEGKATAYVCEGFACKLPVTDAAALQSQLVE
jgi:uncharacterized protein YyaL (SSP411 family)